MAEEWYYASNGQQMGPISALELRGLAASGGLKPSDLVWTDGMSSWTPARATRGLFPAAVPAAASSNVAPAPRSRPRYDDVLDDDDYYPRRSRRAAAAGLSTAALIAIVCIGMPPFCQTAICLLDCLLRGVTRNT